MFKVWSFRLVLFAGAVIVSSASLTAAPGPHETAVHYCGRAGNDDRVRATTPDLAQAIKRLFNFSGKYALEATYYRCAGGNVLVCYVGANLPCDKANQSASVPGATEWCRTNPNSNLIPMVATGHDTVYSWRCRGTKAVTTGKIGKLDHRGFFQHNWKRLR